MVSLMIFGSQKPKSTKEFSSDCHAGQPGGLQVDGKPMKHIDEYTISTKNQLVVVRDALRSISLQLDNLLKDSGAEAKDDYSAVDIEEQLGKILDILDMTNPCIRKENEKRESTIVCRNSSDAARKRKSEEKQKISEESCESSETNRGIGDYLDQLKKSADSTIKLLLELQTSLRKVMKGDLDKNYRQMVDSVRAETIKSCLTFLEDRVDQHVNEL
ncbi:unnamed protein product [Calicophoron daubneyi]|uniref:Uncharacterized protein n=1 Tax=Calicophoron daubneyi TaxID=300641 RepID=A0AAV2TN56_CALDB